MDKQLIFGVLSTKTTFLWTVCQLCRLGHQIVIPVDKQLIFGASSTKTVFLWTVCQLCRLGHQIVIPVDIQLCGRGCFILPEHLFLVWLWQQMSVPKVPLCLI